MAYRTHRGVEITNTYFTGGKKAVFPTLVRSLSAITRRDRTWDRFYIGIASGPDYWSALSRRIDGYKIASNVRRMYLMYESTSSDNVRHIETELEAYYRELRSDDMLNRRGGGGGRRGLGPKFYLYVAVAQASGLPESSVPGSAQDLNFEL